MKRNKIFFMTIAGVAACTIGVLFFVGKMRLNAISRNTETVPRTVESTGNNSDDMSKMETKMAALQRKMNHMSIRQLSMAQNQQPTTEVMDDADDGTAGEDDREIVGDSVDLMEASYVEAENQGLLIDSQMMREGRDPQWSNEAESGISQNILNLSLPQLASEEVTCSANICKVSLDFGKKQTLDIAMNENFRQFTSLATWNSGGFFRADKQGSIHLYFPREGSELPRL
ncbi:MAG: hypothetical protein JXR76_23735 [Deltaproteobacteria bacterium]|nr:hypothetical protein [Deltaproteobacteria bacterium]